VAEHIANPWAGPSVIGQNAAFSGHPPLVASRPARCESCRRSADRSPVLLFTST